MTDRVSDMVRAKTPGLVELRRRLHAMPETAFEENATAELITERMAALGLATRTGVGKTGVVALLEGDAPGPTLMIRSDIDGLPVAEETGLEFASTNGAMHGCGHDGHTAILITAAEILATMKPSLKGKVMFLFQPAEETISGAKAMIEDGVLRDYKPDRAIGLHIINAIPVGQIATNPGPLFSGGIRFKISIRGVPGHAGMPHKAVDSVVIGSQIVLGLQTIVSREISPSDPGVITIGRFDAGSKAGNVISGETVLEGTARAFDEAVLDSMFNAIKRVATGIGEAGRASVEVVEQHRIRATVNDPSVAEWLGEIAHSIVGDGAAEIEPLTGGEDMSEFLHEIPGAYFLVGGEMEGAGMHHSPTFNFDEQCMPTGVELFVRAALDFLS